MKNIRAKSNTVDLLTGNPRRSILQFAAPMLVGNLFQEMYNAVDTLVVGKFDSSAALAAVGAAGVPFMLINAITIGFSVGASILIGQYYGAKGKDDLRRISGTVMIMTLILGIAVTIANYFLCRPLLELLNVKGTLLDSSHVYLQTVGWFLLPVMLYNNLSALLRGVGNAKMPLVFLVICTILNTVLDLVFVVVFRWPSVFAVALATGIAQTVSAILILVYIYFFVPELAAKKREFRIDGQILRKTVKLGLPNAVQTSAVMLGVVVLQRIINDFGDDVIAAYSVGSKINSFAQMPIMSLSSTISTFVAQNLGAGEDLRIKQGVRFTMKIALALTAVLTVLIVIFRHELIGLFTTEGDLNVIRIGGEYLMIYSTFFIFMAAMNIMQGIMNGAGDTMFTMIVSMAMTFLRLPLAYLFTGALHMDYKGAWITFPITWAISLLIYLLRYRSDRWKKAVVGGNKQRNSEG